MIALVLGLIVLAPCGRHGEAARGPGGASTGESPFPITTTTLKSDGERYFVEGRAVLPHDAKVVSLHATTLSGRGEDATLVVSGDLEMRAVTDGRVIIEDLCIELAPDFEALTLIDCELRGTSSIRSAADGAHEGKVYLGKVRFGGKTELSLRMTGGAATIQGCHFDRPFRIQGVPRPGTQESQVEVKVLGCNGDEVGIFGGFSIEGAKECHVAFSDLGGAELLLANCATLELVGNNVRAKRFELRQSRPETFGGTTIQGCDFRAPRIVLSSPRKGDAPEKLVFSECWFGGGTDEDAVRAERVEDGADDPLVGVEAELKQIRADPAGLGGNRD